MMKLPRLLLRLATGLSLLGLTGAAFPALAQKIVPDATLPVNSIVTPKNNTSIITGGTTAGTNLFHSFATFSLPTGSQAYFDNSTNIQNIITRVTGGSVSNIDGLIQANGTANLFLLNPSGIVFGPNAQLNIGGSFLATTASSIKLADGSSFSATNPQSTPLLTINVPIGLQFGNSPGSITNQSQATSMLQPKTSNPVGLQVLPGKTLALVGGKVLLPGGNLTAESGRIELGSVAGNGIVTLTPTAKGFALDYGGVQNFQDIQLSQGALVDASGNGGGDIQVWARRLTLTDGSQIGAQTLGFLPGGTLTVNASDAVELIGKAATGCPFVNGCPSALLTEVVGSQLSSYLSPKVGREGTGHGGNLTIDTKQLFLLNGGVVSTATWSAGQAGDLSVKASDAIEMNGPFFTGLFSTTFGTGAAGNLSVNTGSLVMQDTSEITSSSFAQGSAGNLSIVASYVELSDNTGLFAQGVGSQGNGGNLTIKTGQLLLQGGAQVGVSTFGAGQGGNLNVDATEKVEVSGRTPDFSLGSGLFSQVNAGASGNGGNIVINTSELIVGNGAVISTGNRPASTGRGGNLTINASDSVELSGTATDKYGTPYPSSLVVQSRGLGDAGKLTINTGQLQVTDGAGISAATYGSGNAGNIEVNAKNGVTISGSGGSNFTGFLTSTFGMGNGGNLTIDTGAFHIANGGLLNAQTTSKGAGGNIIVNANTYEATQGGKAVTTSSGAGQSGDITLNVFGSVTISGTDPNFSTLQTKFGNNIIENIYAASGLFANNTIGSTGSSGNIFIASPHQITLSNSASIRVDSKGQGNAGSIQVTADSFTLENQGIFSANTANGVGGNITLQVPNLLQLRQGSSISAQAFGTSNGGNITANSDLVVALENSNIIANAFQGRGGKIQITTQGLYRSPDSHITASSQFGVNGEVHISTPGLDPSKGLVNLPQGIVTVSRLVAQGCSSGRAIATNQLAVTGRGGLPPNPAQPLNDETVLTDFVDRPSSVPARAVITKPATVSPQAQLVEAQGWIVNEQGEVVLVAEAPTVTPQQPWQTPPSCH